MYGSDQRGGIESIQNSLKHSPPPLCWNFVSAFQLWGIPGYFLVSLSWDFLVKSQRSPLPRQNLHYSRIFRRCFENAPQVFWEKTTRDKGNTLGSWQICLRYTKCATPGIPGIIGQKTVPKVMYSGSHHNEHLHYSTLFSWSINSFHCQRISTAFSLSWIDDSFSQPKSQVFHRIDLHIVFLLFYSPRRRGDRGRIQRKTWCTVWGPMPELTITSSYIHSWIDSNTFTMGNPMPESTLSPS